MNETRIPSITAILAANMEDKGELEPQKKAPQRGGENLPGTWGLLRRWVRLKIGSTGARRNRIQKE